MPNEKEPAMAGTEKSCLPPRFRKTRLNPPEAADYLTEVHGALIATATLNKMRCDVDPAIRTSALFLYAALAMVMSILALAGVR